VSISDISVWDAFGGDWSRKRFRKQTPARENENLENDVMWVVHDRAC